MLGDGVDILIVRELTGGLYYGQPKGREPNGNGFRAVDTMIYTSEEIRRIAPGDRAGAEPEASITVEEWPR